MTKSIVGVCMDAIAQKTFYNQYWKMFNIIEADTEELREKAFRLRFEVYCEENDGYFPCGHADKTEYDAYDDTATHFLLIHKESGEVAGTVRVMEAVADSPAFSFPMQEVCDHPVLHTRHDTMKICEVSRLCMAKRFRSRPEDGSILPAYNYKKDVKIDKHSLKDIIYIRRGIPYAPLGLVYKALETALKMECTNCVMAVQLEDFKWLGKMGMEHRVLGPRLHNYGGMQPVIFNIKYMMDNALRYNPMCWELLTDHGRLHHMASDRMTNEWHDTVFDPGMQRKIIERFLD